MVLTSSRNSDGSDRTIAALTDTPLRIQADDVQVALPSAIDDEYITPIGVYPQPTHSPSILSGLHFVSRFFCLLGQVITARRAADRSSPHIPGSPDESKSPQGPTVNGVTHCRPREFTEQLDSILTELPPALQAEKDSEGRTYVTGPSTAEGSRLESFDQSKQAMFATCRANLLVTQALLRLAISRYAAALVPHNQETSSAVVEAIETREGSSFVQVLNSLKSCVDVTVHLPNEVDFSI